MKKFIVGIFVLAGLINPAFSDEKKSVEKKQYADHPPYKSNLNLPALREAQHKKLREKADAQNKPKHQQNGDKK